MIKDLGFSVGDRSGRHDAARRRSDEDAGERWTVIRHGSTEVWREPAVYEAYERFDEVKAILKQRYGKRFRSLTPTKASKMWLYGDHFRSIRFD